MQIRRVYVNKDGPADLYVCTECGYIELFVETGQALEKAKEKFERVKGWLS